jgi:YHS domain-containing protein
MKGLLSLLLFAGFFYFMMRLGCGAHRIHGDSNSHRDLLNYNINHLDLVCGMKVHPNHNYGKIHFGRLYQFCSKNCLEKFDADPGRYLKTEENNS